MAKNARGIEVEEVLSSVRRLIATDRPKPVTPREPDTRLVLSPGQRVEETPHDPVTLEDRIAVLETAISRQSEEWEPDGSEDQSQHRPDRIVVSRDPRHGPLRLSELALVTVPAQDAPADETPSDDDADPVADAVLAFRRGALDDDADDIMDGDQVDGPDVASRNMEAAVNGQRSDTETPLTLVDPVPSPLVLTGPVTVAETPDEDSAVAEETDAIDEPAVFQVDPAGEVTPVAPDDFGEPDIEPLVEEKTAEADAPATAEPVYPQGPSTDWTLHDGTPQSVEDAEVLSEDPPGGDDDAPYTAVAPRQSSQRVRALYGDDLGGDESDDEALRMLVSVLLREELQGELGERITRNVRKLVRREIQRALTARDLN